MFPLLRVWAFPLLTRAERRECRQPNRSWARPARPFPRKRSEQAHTTKTPLCPVACHPPHPSSARDAAKKTKETSGARAPRRQPTSKYCLPPCLSAASSVPRFRRPLKTGEGKRADAEHVGASEPTAPGRRGGGRSAPTLRRRTKRPPPPLLTTHAFVPLCASPAAMGTEVLRPHDCLARSRRSLRPAGKITSAAAAARRGHGARGDCRASAAAAPRQVLTKVAAEAYAGPAFGSMSPSPRALPLPRFSSKAAADASVVVGVDDSATRELRRLLGLH
jgi:hypothetical protein